MKKFAKTVFLIPLFCFCANASAWKFGEHRYVGREAYSEACHFLLNKFNSNANINALIQSMPCSNIDIQARQYGFRNALSADHIKNPEDFKSMEAERQALSWINYGDIALQNHEHFWPRVKYMWRYYHKKALEHASLAKEHLDNNLALNAVEEFEYALILSAFADHFLQDAFSTGHMGFSRINSLQNPSLIYHDDMSNRGRYYMGRRVANTALDPTLTKEKRILLITSDLNTCGEVSDLFEKTVLKGKNINCDTEIWYAFGDGKLRIDENAQNLSRVKKATVTSIISVILTFIYGEDRGYSLLTEALFPTSIEYLEQVAIYGDFLNNLVGESNYRSVVLNNNSCNINGEEVYSEYQKCWFDIENTYTEPVYPDITLLFSTAKFADVGSQFNSVYIGYSPHMPQVPLFQHIPKYLRLYINVDVHRTNKPFEGKSDRYREVGFNIGLPNFYEGTVFSHDLDIAWANFGKRIDHKIDKTNEGMYLGLNTNIDILKAKLVFGVGWFMPDTNFSTAELKGQIMLGWSFGSLGGGPLSRWSD